MKTLSKFTTNRKAENKKTLVAYITAGLDGWIDAVHCVLDNGADIVEIGLPFSDPIMDGPVISKASAIALSNGARTLDLLADIQNEQFSKPITIMTYTNVLYSHGIKEILKPIADAGVSGLILPDLTFETSQGFRDALADTDISLVQLVSSTTNPQRRTLILEKSEGFVYCVAIKGITGQDVELTSTYTEFISPIREVSELPVYCGVGIRSAQDAANLAELSDGVIVGTTLVEKLLNDDKPTVTIGKYIGELRQAIDSSGN